MTFEETIGLIYNRYTGPVTVTVNGQAEAGSNMAINATGTLGHRWDRRRLDLAYANGVEASVGFGLIEHPEVAINVDPQQFRDADLDGEVLTLHVAPDLEIRLARADLAA